MQAAGGVSPGRLDQLPSVRMVPAHASNGHSLRRGSKVCVMGHLLIVRSRVRSNTRRLRRNRVYRKPILQKAKPFLSPVIVSALDTELMPKRIKIIICFQWCTYVCGRFSLIAQRVEQKVRQAVTRLSGRLRE